MPSSHGHYSFAYKFTQWIIYSHELAVARHSLFTARHRLLCIKGSSHLINKKLFERYELLVEKYYATNRLQKMVLAVGSKLTIASLLYLPISLYYLAVEPELGYYLAVEPELVYYLTCHIKLLNWLKDAHLKWSGSSFQVFEA